MCKVGQVSLVIFHCIFMTPRVRRNRSPISICVSVCLYVCVSVCRSVCPSVCPFVCLSIRLPSRFFRFTWIDGPKKLMNKSNYFSDWIRNSSLHFPRKFWEYNTVIFSTTLHQSKLTYVSLQKCWWRHHKIV